MVTFAYGYTGRYPLNAALDEVRVSRSVRYTEDFEVSKTEFTLDAETTALFHFNRSMVGDGMTAAGDRYEIRAVPGVVTYY